MSYNDEMHTPVEESVEIDKPEDPVKGTWVEPAYEAPRVKPRINPGVKMNPWADRIIVSRNEFQQTGRIIIPDTAQLKPTTGIIVGIGPDVPEWLCELNQIIVFSLYGGIPVAFKDGTNYLIMRADEIMGDLNVAEDEVKTETPV